MHIYITSFVHFRKIFILTVKWMARHSGIRFLLIIKPAVDRHCGRGLERNVTSRSACKFLLLFKALLHSTHTTTLSLLRTVRNHT